MKRYLTVLACFTLIGIGLNVHLQFQSDQLDDIGISLTNIEALAQGEDNGGLCFSTGSVDCPFSKNRVLYVW